MTTVGGWRDVWRRGGLASAATAAWSLALVCAYNLVKHVARSWTGGGFPTAWKVAIKGSIPWSVAGFALVAAVVAWRRPARATAVLLAAAVQAVIAPWFGVPAAAALATAAGLSAVVFSCAVAVGRALGGWRAWLGRWEAAGGGRALTLGAVFVAAALACGFGSRQLYRQWENSLQNNGRWIATKTGHEKAVLGAIAYFITRKAVARDRLSLGVWHGYHEVVMREPVVARSVGFSCRVPPAGYLVLRWDDGRGGFDGVRLSRHPRFASQWLRASADGEILAAEPLGAAIPDGWHRVELLPKDRAVAIDGVVVGRAPWAIDGPLRFGFRAGKEEVLVDDVETNALDGGLFTEDFSSRANGWDAFAAGAGGILLLGALVAVRGRRRGRARHASFAPIALAVPSTIGVWLLVAVDFWIVSGANPLWIDYGNYVTRIENEADVVGRLREELAIPDDAPRVVCLGSSQTWGSGAAREQDTWVRQLELALNSPPDGRRIRCVNGGINGEVASRIFAAYRREWADPPPRLVIVTLSHNDADRAEFEASLRELVAFNRARGTATVFVLEPDSIECIADNLLPNHEIMRTVAAETATPVIDMMSRLGEREERGFLWWDHVHLSSCGQRFFAEILAEELGGLGLPD